MAEGIVLLDADGLAAAAALQHGRPDCKAWLFDPTLLDKARDAGIGELELHAWSSAAPYPELAAWAHARAAEFEHRLDRAFTEVHRGASVLGWQHLNLYYLLLTLRWYRELWDEHQARFDDHLVHVLVNDNPAHYYRPSFLPGLLLLQRLMARGTEFKAYSFGRRPDPSSWAPDLRGTSAPLDLLTHLPTCFHDQAWINAELEATGGGAVNLQAQHWDVPVQVAGQIAFGTADALAQTLDGPALERTRALCEQATAMLDAWLQAEITSPEYRRRQVDFLAAMLRAQLLVFEALPRHFADHCPRRMLLSEHDAGFHGPLLSFAARRGVPVLMLPHSKTIGDLEFTHGLVTTLTHPLQAEGVVDGSGRSVPHLRIAYPEQFTGSSLATTGLGRIGLLLNGLSLGGVLSTPYAPYVAGIARIAGWCRQHGVPLTVRSRPGQAMSEMLIAATGLSAHDVLAPMTQTLDDFARNVDLCLMYDAPTSACIDFLNRSVPLLNPIADGLSRAEALTCNPGIVPREDVNATLERLSRWHKDPVQLQLFKQQQFARYVGAFAAAPPLRALLT